jgi:EAL domain-containing protein (putative c-di-GMP-specific phosphodiesterase class I)
MCQMIVLFAKAIGCTATAEGIEDPATIKELLSLGCTRGQGYLLSRPLPASDLEPILLGAALPLS